MNGRCGEADLIKLSEMNVTASVTSLYANGQLFALPNCGFPSELSREESRDTDLHVAIHSSK